MGTVTKADRRKKMDLDHSLPVPTKEKDPVLQLQDHSSPEIALCNVISVGGGVMGIEVARHWGLRLEELGQGRATSN